MPLTSFTNTKISGITAVIPETRIDIDDELEFFNNDEKLLARNKKILGLDHRYVVDDKTTNADLCEAAAQNLINALKIDKSSIDSLIVVSTSHDYHYPASACVLQGRLDLSEECTCFDISGLACSAYVHGLMLAHSMISSGASKKCLLLAGDLTSRHSDRRNRNSNMLFGDAGTATLLEYTLEDNTAFFYTGTRGKSWDKLIAPAGGYALPIRDDIAKLEVIDKTGNVWHLYDDIMKGLDVFKFATDIGARGIKEILNFANIDLCDVDYVAFHQANKQIVNTIAMYAKVPKGKYSTEAFSKFANCGAAAVTMDICRRLLEGPVNILCLATFGVGLSWGFALVNSSKTYVENIKTYITPSSKLTREENIKHWIDYFNGGNNA